MPESGLADNIRSITASLTTMINSLVQLHPDDATSINTALTRSSFPAEFNVNIAQVVQTKVTGSGRASGDGATVQTLAHPYNYMTATDWQYIQDLAGTQYQCAVLIRNRLHLCGLHKQMCGMGLEVFFVMVTRIQEFMHRLYL